MEILAFRFRRLLIGIIASTPVIFGSCHEEDTITDIHIVSEVSFEVTGWVVDELCYWDCLALYPVSNGEVNGATATGIIVPIFLSHPATEDGSFHISLSDSLYGKAFTTIPAPSTDGVIEFSIAKGASGSSFTVLPIDNNEQTNGFLIQFNIGNVTGSLHDGACTKYMLTIQDDED
jgi:hypothetical protein